MEYVGQRAPARVLEFGCGVGRHLKNLVKLPNVEVYGCDQSPTMLEGIATVAPAMALDRVTLIEPLRRLPYPDDEFDLVFTCEVLEHVAPEDLSSVLCEFPGFREARSFIWSLPRKFPCIARTTAAAGHTI